MCQPVFTLGLVFALSPAAVAGASGTTESVSASGSSQSSDGEVTPCGIGGDNPLEPNLPPVEVAPTEVLVPEPPDYLVRRSERLDAAHRDLRERLNRPVALDFKNVPLRQAIEQIAAQIEAPLRIDETALTDEGVSIDDPIPGALRADVVAAEEAFRHLLDPYDLEIVIDGEFFVVTTATVADDILSVRVYPVADLVVAREDGRLMADFNEMITLFLQATSGPWFDIDGVGGTVVASSRGGALALVVRQTEGVHREIEKILFDLRRSRPPEALEALLRPAEQSGLTAEVPTEAPGTRRRALEPVETASEDLSPATRDLIDSLEEEKERFPASLRSRIETLQNRLRGAREGEEVRPADPDRETTVVVPIPPALRESTPRR